MLNNIFGRMSSSHRPSVADAEPTRASPSNSILSAATAEDSSNVQSSSSTPPTSIGDSASVSSTSLKLPEAAETPDTPVAVKPSEPSRRSVRSKASVATYNVKVLVGTAIHTPQKYNKNPKVVASRRRTIAGGSALSGALDLDQSSTPVTDKDIDQAVTDGIDALDLQLPRKSASRPKSRAGPSKTPKKSSKSSESDRRLFARSATENPESPPKKKSILGKRAHDETIEKDEHMTAMKARELKRLLDTPEYRKIETVPVIHEVWSNGKLVVEEPHKKKRKVEHAVAEKPSLKVTEKEKPKSRLSKLFEPEPEKPEKKLNKNGKREKIWLVKGLYAGQENPDYNWSNQAGAEKSIRKYVSPYQSINQPNKILPLPMWHGKKLLEDGRDFKLPFDVCSPLPPGQPKPDEWRKTSSNRFVGEASALWKKSILFDSFSSKCICTPERGCDESCQNRIMFYECDDTNCGAGRDTCTNRAFATLMERRKAGGKYRIGVEVIKTADRGYGVRSNRCFDANQIIVEYTGEIITEDECDRRMNEDYKNNECYYLMLFDQNMVLDATKGSIARFVNHSCKPNCRMVKWIVGGKPRMALFAGDNPIMTGDELTYDYNFDPFSSKNIQECRCGNDNCRGVLGPKPKDLKVPKTKDSKLASPKKSRSSKPKEKSTKNALKEAAIKEALRAGMLASKRKLKELLGSDASLDDDDTDDVDLEIPSPKKRKILAAKGVKAVKKPTSTGLKGVGAAVKKSLSAHLTKATVRKPAHPAKREFKVKTAKASSLKTYSKGQTKTFSSRKSAPTKVASRKLPSIGKKSLRKNPVKSMRASKKGSRASTILATTDDDEVNWEVEESDDEYFEEDEE